MRVSPFVIAFAALVGASNAHAQVRAAALVQRPEGSCDAERVETVIVAGPGGARSAALDSIAHEIAYWFRPEPASSVRNTSYEVLVGRDTIGVRQRSPAGDAAFDRATRQAVDAAAHEKAFDSLVRQAGAPAVTVTVHFGEQPGGRQSKFVERAFCWAVQRPDSPRPSFPLELAPTNAQMASNEGTTGVGQTFLHGEVEARFLVDTAGRVDPASVQILSSSHEGFTREVKRVVPLLRYFPAELGGRPAAQMVEQRFEFSAR